MGSLFYGYVFQKIGRYNLIFNQTENVPKFGIPTLYTHRNCVGTELWVKLSTYHIVTKRQQFRDI